MDPSGVVSSVLEVMPMTIVRVGLDTAKQVFQAHGADRTGKVVLPKRLKR
jgi:hypothetical protein